MEPNINNEFYCEKCNYKTNKKFCYETHLKTELHLNGKRKIRSDKKDFTCEFCDYKSTNGVQLQSHILNIHKEKSDREKGFKFYCSKCDFGTFNEEIYNNHNESTKHKRICGI